MRAEGSGESVWLLGLHVGSQVGMWGGGKWVGWTWGTSWGGLEGGEWCEGCGFI